jgi:phosphate transport system ATP-binding protein
MDQSPSTIGGPRPPLSGPGPEVKIAVQNLSFFYGRRQALRNVTLDIPERGVNALIGPSGCGKTTLLKVFHRMYDLIPGARAEGQVRMGSQNVLATRRLLELRQRVGMVFQRPTLFPMSIRDNVAFGPRLLGWKRPRVEQVVERSLRAAALWDEVKDRLRAPATSLSGGQQQRLAIARCIAVDPEVVLMDEPCSALDPLATAKIEELIRELAERYSIVIVTHNLQQATRLGGQTAFLLMNPSLGGGELIEVGPTAELFARPRDRRTEDYIAGRFG